MIYGTLFGCAAVGVALIVVGRRISRGQWRLGEHGVQLTLKGVTTTWMFRDVTETCQFYRSGVPVGLAWRAGHGDWATVNGHLGGYRRFFDAFVQGCLQERVPLLLDKLERGHVVDFKILNMKGQVQKLFVHGIGGYVDASTDAVRLTRSSLSFAEKVIAIDSIKQMDISAWTSRIGILLQDGSYASISYTALFDMHMLVALLDELIRANNENAAMA